MNQSNPTEAHPSTPEADAALQRKILARMAKQTFCTVATTSPAGRPHVAGVVYELVDSTLWVHLSDRSRKARSISANPHVAVCIPFRRLPVGPPYTIHFQARAELVAMDDARVTSLLDAGRLSSISGHGALDMPDGCFVAIEPERTIHSFGPGASVLDLIRNPLTTGARRFEFTGVTR